MTLRKIEQRHGMKRGGEESKVGGGMIIEGYKGDIANRKGTGRNDVGKEGEKGCEEREHLMKRE